MLLRSGRATFTGLHRRSSGSTSACGSAGRLGLKRKSSVGEEAAPDRQVRSKSSPGQPPVALPTTAPGVSALEVRDDSSDDASVADLGVKMFPSLPPEAAAAIWVDFVHNAKTCINHYNNTHQEASFVYKHAIDNGSILVGEQDGSYYFHLNFIAQDKKGFSQLFFGEIRLRAKDEDVTCCCPVSSSTAGGKSIRTIEEAMKFEFPKWGTAGMDQEHCYACPPRMKHPIGTLYVAGHYADSRQYYMF